MTGIPAVERRRVLRTSVSLLDYTRVADLVERYAVAGLPFAVAAAAVHPIALAAIDASCRADLEAIDLVVADGQPVRWALNAIHGAGMTDRVYGPQLTLDVCERAAARDLGVFLHGSTEPVLAHLADALTTRFPGLRIAGTFSPPFGPLPAGPVLEDVERIRRSGARIVLVALGSPKQERWVARHRDALGVPVLSVGAAFDFLSGNKPQAPVWMQRRGLEWLHRLASEPRRLFFRYTFFNTLFVILVTGQYLVSRLGGGPR